MTEENLFTAALERHTPEERRAFLDQACGADADLRRRLDELLHIHDATGGLLDKPPPAVADPGPATPTVSIAPPTAGERPGTRIGPYKLLEKIGEGGMGTVYMAEQDKPVRRRVALKIIKAGMDSAQVVARFESERQALALMDHPNIARVLEAGTTEAGRPYFVMELVKGIPITRFCDEARLTPRQRLDLFLPVCQAVQHAHQKGIIHRDLKPSNILVALYDDKPVPKVIDFGVAKATGEKLTDATLFTGFGAVVGTLEYMSPEQARMNALDVDTRADIYSLGVVLYELLTGSTPFDKTRLKQAAYDEWLRIIREEEPARPSTRLSGADSPASVAASRNMEPAQLTRLVRGELDWIVMKSLEKDRTRRYETANGLARDIQRYLADEAVEACPPSARYRLGKLVRKHKRALATAAAFVLLLIAGVIVSSWLAVRATDAERLAGERLSDVESSRSKLQNALAETKEAHGKTSQALLDTRVANETTKQALESLRKANEKTKEALKESEESRKEAEEVSAFMTEAFGRANPTVDGRNLKVADILAQAEMKLASRKNLNPLVRAQLYATISDTYASLGLREEAISAREKAWRLRREHLGATHSKTIDDLTMLHRYNVNALKPLVTAPHFEEALEESLKKFGPQHATSRTLMRRTLEVYGSWADPKKGLELVERFPQLLQLQKGESEDDLLKAIRAAASAYVRTGQVDKGVRLMEEHIERTRAALGPGHVDTIQAMYDLADVWLQARQHPERDEQAIKHRERALAQARTSLGNGGALTVQCMHMLANDLKNHGEHDRAAKLYKELLDSFASSDEKSHVVTLYTFWHGEQLLIAGQPAKAIPFLEKALANKDRYGDDHAMLQQCMYCLGLAYHETGDLEKADTMLAVAAALTNKRLSADNFHTLNVTRMSIRTKIRLGKFAEADALLPTNPLPAKWYYQDILFGGQRGAVYVHNKEFARAEPLLLAANKRLAPNARRFPEKLDLRDNLDWLVRLYEDWGKADEAAKWRAIRDKNKSQPTK